MGNSYVRHLKSHQRSPENKNALIQEHSRFLPCCHRFQLHILSGDWSILSKVIIMIIIVMTSKGAVGDILPSPAQALSGLASRVQITCNTSGAYHVQNYADNPMMAAQLITSRIVSVSVLCDATSLTSATGFVPCRKKVGGEGGGGWGGGGAHRWQLWATASDCRPFDVMWLWDTVRLEEIFSWEFCFLMGSADSSTSRN